MTVSNALHCSPTDEIFRASNTVFYPAAIPAAHHQLRHLISTAEEGRIYYATLHDVYSLEIRTRTCTLVATLPLIIQSLVAGYGWVCVGGSDNGHCAFLKITRDEEPEGGEGEGQPLAPPRCFGHDLTFEALGGEIVNSMNIHQFSQGLQNETETVVLISNNDKTVKIYSLNQQMVLTTLKHPCPMNYANFSPDSTLLVACGDTDRVFFYKRHVVDENEAVYGWQSIGAPRVPVHGDVNDYSFSVAFSPSGLLCAVSAQGGMITVFDLTNFEHYAEEKKAEVAILCSFKSARDSSWGFVRSMAFSPEPYGLLAWAEDYGRVGVADVRQHFIRRQVLKLEKGVDEVKKVDVRNTTPAAYNGLTFKELWQKQEIERLMLLHAEEHNSPVPSPSPTEAEAGEARPRRPRRQPSPYDQGLNLDSRGRSVLDTLEPSMDGIQPRSPRSSYPYSVSYTSSLRVRPAAGNNAPERSDRNDRTHMPRRRTSVVLSPSRNENETHPSILVPRELPRNRMTVSPSRIPHPSVYSLTADDLPGLMSTNDRTAQLGGSTSQPHPYDIPPSDPWSGIQSALESARAADNDMATLRRLHDTLDTVESGINTLEHHAYTWQPREPAIRTRISASAETSALPTTTVRAADATQHVLNTIRRQQEEQHRLQAEQRYQNARLDNLERQIRRDARAAISTASELEAIENAAQRGANSDRHARIVEQRAQARARQAAHAGIPAEAPDTSTASRDETRLNTERYLANRAHDAERMRMLYRAREAMDQNGNRMTAGAAATTPLQRPSELSIATQRTETDELRRERGLGSTGVGWSADGLTLYCGSEEGVFEFQLNIRDRMQFPSLELR